MTNTDYHRYPNPRIHEFCKECRTYLFRDWHSGNYDCRFAEVCKKRKEHFNDQDIMTPQQTYTDILQSFTHKDETHPVLGAPFIQQGYACATDAHIAIAIPLTTCGQLKYTMQDRPDLIGLIPDEREGEKRTVRELKELPEPTSTGPAVGDDCPECDGLGCVQWKYRDHEKIDDCPYCGGSGIINYIEEPQVKYAGFWFQHKYLKLIADTCDKLGITEFKVEPGTTTCFRLDGGIVILLMICLHTEGDE